VVAEDVARGTPAGVEHGSTLASSVVAEDVARSTPAGVEHGSTLASSVVAEDREGARRMVLNMAPRWPAAWWPKIAGGHAGWC